MQEYMSNIRGGMEILRNDGREVLQIELTSKEFFKIVFNGLESRLDVVNERISLLHLRGYIMEV